MEGFDLFDTHYWQPLAQFGYTNAFFNISRTTVINTWIVLAIIFVTGICIRSIIKRDPDDILRYVVMSFIVTFKDMVDQTLGFFSLKHFAFVASLFIYIVLCNCISIIPGTEEPTRDLNTTLALGIISFLYVQIYAIKAHGLLTYIKEFFAPFFLMLPLNVIGKLATIISMSFRLFGNIFGGSTIAAIYFRIIYGAPWLEALGSFTGINLLIILFFGIFEGVIQAFVFAMLTLTYLSTAITHEFPEEQEGIP
ncbi:MAG: FoF1 ATP synthase subunit a [Candidatus Dependentiae bacterium]